MTILKKLKDKPVEKVESPKKAEKPAQVVKHKKKVKRGRSN